MKITESKRKLANKIISKYTRNLITSAELNDLYAELSDIGITFMITGRLEDVPRWHTYELEGEMVENSGIVFGKYYPSERSNRFELTCYLS